jgi:2,3-dihydroxybiphenyl 1,2-dioxygenase
MSGVIQLGYLGFEVSAPDVWRAFAHSTLGLALGERFEDGGFSLRLDSYPQRFFIQPGPLDDAAFVGWQVADAAALEAIAARLPGFTRGTAEECARRHVAGLIKFEDPSGMPGELFHGPDLGPEPTLPPVVRSRFVAGELGLGHVVIGAEDPQRSIAFYRDVLGFKLSDEIRCRYFGHDVDLAFFHVNGRHHSLALGRRYGKRIHHFMLEVASIDDVGLCFDRALRSKVPIAQTLGKHPNDRMFSFYGLTPSGFQFEYGHGGRIVNDAEWQTTTYDHISVWGHHPPIVFAPREKRA